PNRSSTGWVMATPASPAMAAVRARSRWSIRGAAPVTATAASRSSLAILAAAAAPSGSGVGLAGLGVGGGQLHQRPHTEAGAALPRRAVDLLRVGGAGDVEVGPRDAVVDEVRQEHPGRQRPAVAGVGDVLDVGDLALELALQVAGQRQRP